MFPQSLSLLTERCPALVSCLDLDYWAGVTGAELERLSREVRLNNVRLALSEEDSGERQSDGGLSDSTSNLMSLCTD